MAEDISKDVFTPAQRTTTDDQDTEATDNASSSAGSSEPEATYPKRPAPPPPSKLPKSVQELLEWICDIQAIENAVKEMKFDASKAPLGKLTTAQIEAGYDALKEIETCILRRDFGSALKQACDQYYLTIPHDFGMKTPPLIRSEEDIKEELQLLRALRSIEVVIRTMAEGNKEHENPNLLDTFYDAMRCGLTPLDRNSDLFKFLENYLSTTQATHRIYKLELLDAFECVKEGEASKFRDVGNKMLLWHGSRLCNWYRILSQGLRIAPAEAPVAGYMFGKGVYFADLARNSSGYCYPSRSFNRGLLALCEVSLGKCRELVDSDFKANELPDGFHSVKGLGQLVPDESEYVPLDNGCMVPCGTTKKGEEKARLPFNEYVVYDTAQIKFKYLLKVKFLYKGVEEDAE